MLAAMLASAAPTPGDVESSDLDDEPDSEAQPVPKEGPYTPLINVPRNQNNGYSPGRYPPSAEYQNELKGGPGSMLAAALAGGGMQPIARQMSDMGSAAPPGPPSGTHYAQLPGPPLLLAGADNGAPASSENPLAGIGRMLGIGGAAPSAPSPAASGAAPSDASQPITGQTSDMAGGDPYTQYLQQHQDAAIAHYNQAVAAAQRAAASGNPDAAAVTQSWLKQADAYRAEVEKTQALYGETLKSKGTQLTEEQRTALGLPTGVYNKSAEGTISPIGGTQEDKDTSEVQNYKFDQENRQKLGLPPISFSDWNTQKTMYGKGERPLVDAQGKEIDAATTGDELLQALPPAVSNHAKAIAEIREKWPSGTEQARQPQLQQALAAAQQLDPSLNQQTYQTRQAMKNSAEAGSGRINVANLANNTALFHSSSLADAIVSLNNSNNTVVNAAVNSGAGMAGGIIPGAVNKADQVKQFNEARDAVGNELERSFHGVGTTAEQAVKRQIDDLSVNDAPQTQLGALKKAQELLKGKIEANEADYRDTMGEKNIAAWERDHARPFGFITPAAQAAGDRVAAMYESVKAGKGFHGFDQGAGSPATAPAQAARTAPAAPSADPLTAARDAISRGAPRAAVIQRLQQNGINPAGL